MAEFPERYKKLGFSGYNQPKKSNRPERTGILFPLADVEAAMKKEGWSESRVLTPAIKEI
jgi:hypothetical protein